MEAEGITMACYGESLDKSFAHQEPLKSHCNDDSAASDARRSATACFDCSICLDFAVDPVVTLCGHLYCWPCIYKWLQVETTSPQQCPVCKSPLSENSLVPLYGHGNNSNVDAKNKGLKIPNRPAVQRDTIDSVIDEQPYSYPRHANHHHNDYLSSTWGGTSMFSSTAGGVLGGLAIAILPLISGSDQGAVMQYSRMNRLAMSRNSARQRLYEMRMEHSLQQIWGFLFFCAVLCLLLF